MLPEYQDRFDVMDQSFLFFSIFKVWEVEELACVRDYIIRRYTKILRRVPLNFPNFVLTEI
jgi:hypothetical protein